MFYKTDFEWLKERLIIDREKCYWDEQEKEQLKLLEVAYKTVMETGNPDRWITVGCLYVAVGLREYDIKGRLHQFSNLREFIESKVERREVWLPRRIVKMAELKKRVGEKLKLSDIWKKMRLKPNIYKKYADFIGRVLRSLNNCIIYAVDLRRRNGDVYEKSFNGSIRE